MNEMTPTSPIRLAMNLLDQRINKLQDVCDRLFTALQPVTSNSDEKYPIEKIAREGNSDLNCSLNKMSDRLEEIMVALQLQTDRLEM
jgi:predicted neuraminidase